MNSIESLEASAWTRHSSAGEHSVLSAVALDFSALAAFTGSSFAAADAIQRAARAVALALRSQVYLFRQFMVLRNTSVDETSVIPDAITGALGQRPECATVQFDLPRSNSLPADLWALVCSARSARHAGLKAGSSSMALAYSDNSLEFLSTPPPTLAKRSGESFSSQAETLVSPLESLCEATELGFSHLVSLDFVGYNRQAASGNRVTGYGLSERLVTDLADFSLTSLADPSLRKRAWLERKLHQDRLLAILGRLAVRASRHGARLALTSADCGVGNDGVALLARELEVDEVCQALQSQSALEGMPCAVVVSPIGASLAETVRQVECCHAATKWQHVASSRTSMSWVPCKLCTSIPDEQPTHYELKQSTIFANCPWRQHP